MFRLFHFQAIPGIAYDVVGDEALGLTDGSEVVVQCDRFQESGCVRSIPGTPPFADTADLEQKRSSHSVRRLEGEHYPNILRQATPQDRETVRQNDLSTADGFRQVRQRIESHGLPMRLTSLHYTFDRQVLFCLYIADCRIDFRELIRDLGALFRCRIEMRQIGLREEASLLGGIGICGRVVCCRSFLRKSLFSTVNALRTMQRTAQNHPGICGKTMCCMQFEEDASEKSKP